MHRFVARHELQPEAGWKSCAPVNYSTEILRTLDPVISDWWDLFHHSPDVTPFQSPAWLLPWWHCFGRGDPIAVAVRQHTRLCGLGLFYIYDEDRSAGRQIFFVGKGVSDYLDVVIEHSAKERRAEIAQRMFAGLFDYSDESANHLARAPHFLPDLRKVGTSWQCADFDRLPPDSTVLDIDTPKSISAFHLQEGICPELPLNGRTLNELIKKSTRDQLRKHFNRARSMGDLQFVTANNQNLSSLSKELVRLDRARWSAEDKPGIFDDRRMLRFICDTAEELLRAHMLLLHAMLLNDQVVAASFAMLHGERLYFYLCDFDPAYATISPGTMLTAHVIEQAANEGAKFFDFLQGDEQYKFAKWGAQPRPTYRLRCLPKPARAAA
jgi:CelD/BcsL family acetyltransferase involved in cellulose biosynthesis